MTEDRALIRTVLAAPADDAPRLVYSDWLEERGRGDDAEFIRTQVELARRGFGGAFALDAAGRTRHVPPDVERLTVRQLELWFAGHGKPDLPGELANWPMTVHPTPGQNMLIRRGFVERLTTFSDIFLEIAGDLFARQPVTHVRLVDLFPLQDGDEHRWGATPTYQAGRSHVLPPELLGFAPQDGTTFPTADAAEAALSWTCVRYGRAAAGLES